MGEAQFSPDEIRRLSGDIAGPLRMAVEAGQREAAAAAGIGLPRFLGDGQDSGLTDQDLVVAIPPALAGAVTAAIDTHTGGARS